ncbi:MAG TPA: hypothetical protein VIB01_09915 [Steroidobacteraceae bacterium]
MNEPMLGRDDQAVKAAVRGGLAARDRALPPPPFARAWPGGRRPRAGAWRPALAGGLALTAIAAVAWMLLARPDGKSAPAADLRAATELARELSSPDYWRVPTDELLAFAAPPLDAELPSPEGFNVSLEESLL